MAFTRRFQLLAAALAAVVSFAAFAQQPPPEIPEPRAAEPRIPEPAEPPPPPPGVTGEQVEPSVIIREEEDRMIEEYSINGRVYMVKVTPTVGPPYYYMDADGDGQLELQPFDEASQPVQPAYWKVKEW